MDNQDEIFYSMFNLNPCLDISYLSNHTYYHLDPLKLCAVLSLLASELRFYLGGSYVHTFMHEAGNKNAPQREDWALSKSTGTGQFYIPKLQSASQA